MPTTSLLSDENTRRCIINRKRKSLLSLYHRGATLRFDGNKSSILQFMSFACWVTTTCRSWLGHTDRSTNKAYKWGREEFCFDIQDLDCWGGLLPLFILRSTGMTSILQDAGIGKCNNRKWLQRFAFRPRVKANKVKTKILIQKIKKQNASRDLT